MLLYNIYCIRKQSKIIK
ncbi:30S ribosomal protein S20 [Crocosphaera chwakensis CCY0110]|uniref:30S ribosomal protein S20 n=1 Tax=Crocosphaera chwakensis CCY0110 TaxID=391612 RepID=A3IJI8_9CHRO|nr:30S ribosomal protein S20 [Crocosphaera chwakensis CCY0110]